MEVMEKLIEQAILEILGEGTYQVSTKISGSIEDLAATLANFRSLTTASTRNGFSALLHIFLKSYTCRTSELDFGTLSRPTNCPFCSTLSF